MNLANCIVYYSICFGVAIIYNLTNCGLKDRISHACNRKIKFRPRHLHKYILSLRQVMCSAAQTITNIICAI